MGVNTNHREYVDDYAERRRINEESKRWADRDGERWESWEDDFLIAYWIGLPADVRDEEECSRLLERTIEACRVRTEKIRARLGITVVRTTTITIEEQACPECWLVHPGDCGR